MHINLLRFFLQMNSCIINIGNTGIFANVLDGIEIEYFIENEVEDMFHFDGILVGIASLCIIGIFHPLVIWSEYYFSERIWPVYFMMGLFCLILSLFMNNIFSVLLGILGCSFLWSIKELKEQTKRVARGWFPQNSKRKQKMKSK